MEISLIILSSHVQHWLGTEGDSIMTNYTLSSSTELVSFQVQLPTGVTDPDLAMVWIHRCPRGGDAGSYMARQYMVQTARVIYRELLAKGYKRG